MLLAFTPEKHLVPMQSKTIKFLRPHKRSQQAFRTEVMKYVDRKTYGQDDLEKLVTKIPFFREISASNQEQFNLLLDVSKIAQAETNEELIKQGSRDDYLYFLLKGMLDVKAGNTKGKDTIINSIHTGEVFGALAMLMNSERTATIVASPGSKEVIMLALPYSLFQGTDEFEQFTLPTELSFYRMLTNNIRWTIDEKICFTH